MRSLPYMMLAASLLLTSEMPVLAADEPATDGAPSSKEITEVTFISRVIEDVIVWYPETVEVAPGARVAINIINELDQPHGFSIPGLVNPTVIEPFARQRLNLLVPKKGSFAVECHLHPPHQAARLVIKD